MDLMMPGLNGLETTARIAREFPEVRVLILSMNAAEEFVLPAVRAGASGYLLKNVSPAELERARPGGGAGGGVHGARRLRLRHRRLPPAGGR